MITICFDVDGTLIHQEGDPGKAPDTPRYDVIQLFHLLESFGCEMYIWSGGGVDYAARWAEKLGLKAKIAHKMSFMPNIIVDDMPLEMEGLNCVCINV